MSAEGLPRCVGGTRGWSACDLTAAPQLYNSTLSWPPIRSLCLHIGKYRIPSRGNADQGFSFDNRSSDKMPFLKELVEIFHQHVLMDRDHSSRHHVFSLDLTKVFPFVDHL